MIKIPAQFRRLSVAWLLTVFILSLWIVSLNSKVAVAANPEAGPTGGDPHLGYGFNVAPWDVALLQSLGFDWMKVFDAPVSRQPVNILLRIEADAQDMGDLNGYGQMVRQIAQNNGQYIEAYEIGNEPNLDADYGWNAPPIAADYAALLCVAYQNIKQFDPTAVIVSAGLAPTGRVQGNWNGHAGHNGLYQDEREYLLEFLAAGGGECMDALGYHPYGFSADYNAAPDVPSADPTQNCVNGFCFRGVEKIHQLMQANNYGGTPIWATEFGWIVAPPMSCMYEPGWMDRAWQIVSEQKQASNLAGAFAYAEANWPWMGVMFVFNLNFNAPGWYDICEQMRYYAVDGRPAETALGNMPKNPIPTSPVLSVSPATLRLLVDVDEMPLTTVTSINLANGGWQTMVYTASVTAQNGLTLTLPQPNGQVGPLYPVPLQLTIQINQGLGVYTADLLLESTPETTNAPAGVPIEVHVIPQVYKAYLPALTAN